MIAPLIATAQALMAPGKGLLAMDESVDTCNQRLAEFGIAQTEVSRRRYRELLVTAPGLSDSISGAILFDETLHQDTGDGTPFVDVLRAAGMLGRRAWQPHRTRRLRRRAGSRQPILTAADPLGFQRRARARSSAVGPRSPGCDLPSAA